MTYEEFIQQIENSNADDWLYDDEFGTYVFKQNISITMKQDRTDDEDFNEEWVGNFIHHPTAKRMRIFMLYNNSIVDTFYTASVDESRMYIPYPKIKDHSITEHQYKIGRIVNIPHCNVIDRYDEYLQTAEIKVK